MGKRDVRKQKQSLNNTYNNNNNPLKFLSFPVYYVIILIAKVFSETSDLLLFLVCSYNKVNIFGGFESLVS